MSDSLLVEPGAKGMLSALSPWLNDKEVSEIIINRPQEVFIEKKGQMTRHEVASLTPLYLRRLFNFIANESGQILDEAHPLLSASLYDGARVQLVIPPVSEHYALSIRRSSIKPMFMEDYEASGFFDMAKPFDLNGALIPDEPEKVLLSEYQNQNWPSFLKQAVALRKNIVVSGSTSSGKTTFLNMMLNYIPKDERIITLEDTREVILNHPNRLSLLASKGGQSKAKVNMQDLVQCCLRLRPERIIMGEIRGAEILDFISACSTGHEGSITSIHAKNPKIAFMRMVQMYKLNNVPSMQDTDILKELHEVVDVIVQLHKGKLGRKMAYCYYKGANNL